MTTARAGRTVIIIVVVVVIPLHPIARLNLGRLSPLLLLLLGRGIRAPLAHRRFVRDVGTFVIFAVDFRDFSLVVPAADAGVEPIGQIRGVRARGLGLAACACGGCCGCSCGGGDGLALVIDDGVGLSLGLLGAIAAGEAGG